jgi:hypothetical protein
VPVDPVADPAWLGEKNKCHENVEKWIALHPQDRAIRGYLVSPQTEFSAAVFDLHSVIQLRDGSLVDVTPLCYPLLFVRHDMSEEQFQYCKGHFGQLQHLTEDAGFEQAPEDDEGPSF